VARDDVVDDRAVVLGRRRAEGAELLLGPEGRIDLHADAVEVAVDGRCLAPAVEAARLLDRAGVDGVDPDLRERLPERRLGEPGQERLPRAGDERQRIGGEPHRRPGERGARVRVGERVLEHAALAGELDRQLLASQSIDSSTSHFTYLPLPALGSPWTASRTRSRSRRRATGRSRVGRAG
jgi:hypothetical protein